MIFPFLFLLSKAFHWNVQLYLEKDTTSAFSVNLCTCVLLLGVCARVYEVKKNNQKYKATELKSWKIQLKAYAMNEVCKVLVTKLTLFQILRTPLCLFTTSQQDIHIQCNSKQRWMLSLPLTLKSLLIRDFKHVLLCSIWLNNHLNHFMHVWSYLKQIEFYKNR